jgi:hypothetical protein
MRKLLLVLSGILYTIQMFAADTEFGNTRQAPAHRKIPLRFTNYSSYLLYHNIKIIKGIDSARSYYLQQLFSEPNGVTVDYLPLTAGSSYPLTGALYGTSAVFSGGGSFVNDLRITGDDPGKEWLTLANSTGARAFKLLTGINGISNTGFSIQDVTNNAVRFVISDAGNVGIGTPSPASKLDIRGAVNVYSRFDFTASRGVLRLFNNSMGLANSQDLGIDFTPSLGSPFAGIYSGWHETTSDGFLSFKVTNDFASTLPERMRISSAGNVGIGTNAPIDRVHIEGADIGLRMNGTVRSRVNMATSSQNGWQIEVSDAAGNQAAGDLGFTESGISSRMVLQKGGNVGIGTTTPGAKLDVLGAQVLHIAGAGDKLVFAPSAAGSGANMYVTNDAANAYAPLNLQGSKFTFLHGNVGIGTSTPVSKLEITGATNVYSRFDFNATRGVLRLFNNSMGLTNSQDLGIDFTPSMGNPFAGIYSGWQESVNDGFLSFKVTNDFGVTLPERMRISSTGNVGIGTSDPGPYKLAVNGNIRAKKLVVETGWSDYVFNDDYHLRSLSAVEKFIRENKHLPDVPSAKEVEKNGISVGDSQAVLLKKIEELTLYMIALEKKVNLQEQQLNKYLKKGSDGSDKRAAIPKGQNKTGSKK